MDTVFVAQSFHAADRDLVDGIIRLLTNFGLTAILGSDLGGGSLAPEVMERINQADAFIALATRREQLPDGEWTTSDWVRDEISHARGKNKPCTALVEQGVKLSGAYLGPGYEHILIDREKPLGAFLRVTDTLRVWRDKYGRLVRVRLQRDEAAALARSGAVCQYRLIDHRGRSPAGKAEGSLGR